MKKNNSLLQLVVLMAAMLCALGASADEAYACYSPSYTTLTFYYDNQRNIRSGTTYDLNTGGIQPGWVTDGTNASVTKVVFNSSFAGARPTSTFSWFYEMQNLQSITGLNYLNTSEVTKMNWMFGYCSSLTSLDLSTFNTSNVTDMGSMFFGSENLKILDLSGFNTTKVTNMASMFWSCAELLTVLVDSNWSTTAVTNSVNMFYNCTSLLGGKGTTFNYSNPRDKTYAHIDGGTSNPGYFTAAGTEAYACYTSSNTTLTFYYDTQRSSRTGTTYDMNPDGNVSNPSPVWSTDGTSSYVTKVVFTPSFANARPRSTSSWFYFMRNLQDITGIEYLNTSEVTTMSSMFSWCDNLTSLDLSHFNTSKVISMYGMFQECSNLQTIYVGDGWRAATVVYSAKMFDGSTSLVGEQGTTYDASHTDKAYAHIDGGPSNPGYLSEWKEPYACYTPSNTTLTFYCDNLRSSRSGTTYDLNTENEVPGWEISGDNASVTKVVFDPSFAYARPTTTYDWFYDMTNLLSITGMSYLNTSEVTAMTDMFDYCTKLTDLDLSHFNTAKVTDMDGMFGYCTSLTSLDLTCFNTSNLTEMRFMFYNCNQLRTIYVGNGWTMANEPDAYCMFLGCTSLVGGLGTTYSASHTDAAYAHIDGGPSNPGYFTEFKEAYACYTPSNTTLTFYCDTQRSSRTGTTYDLNTDSYPPAWDDENYASVTQVVFDPSFADARPTSTVQWFCSMQQLESIEGINYLNTSEVTNMSAMFAMCFKLTSIDVSHFNTAKVTNMRYMFASTPLTTLDLSSFNTAQVEIMASMFIYCNQLQTIYVGADWSTAAVTESTDMFASCPNLLGGKGTTWSSSNPTDKTYAHIDGGSSNPGYLTDIRDLNGIIFEVDGIYYKLDTYDVLVTHDGTGQYGCYSGTVEIPEEVYYEADGRWYPVTGIDERAFYRCPYLQHVILPNSIDIIHNEAFMDAFYNASNCTVTCMALTPPTISSTAFNPYDIEQVTLYVPYGSGAAYQGHNYWNAFGNIVELNYSFKKNGIYYKITGDGKVSVTNKDGNYNTYSGRVSIPRTVTSGGVNYTVTAIDNVAFFNCPNLTDVVIPETVTAIGNTTFKGCTSLTSITIPNSVTRMGLYAFENCTALNNVVIGSGMTSIGIMAFHGCTALETGTITCLALDPPTINNQNAFDTNHYHNSTLYVPQSACADYQQAQYWRDFYDMRELWTLDDALNEDGGTIHFESTSAYPWKVVTDGGGALHYAESGNAGVPNTTSTLTATVTVPEGGATLSFTFQAWGEGNEDDRIYDCCAFAIDGTTRLEYGEYQNDWESYSVDLPAGTHTLKWSYSKDASVDPEGDYFAIDHVTLTPKAAGLLGDVDGDGNVGIADVTLLIDYVLTGNSTGVNLDVSNVDGDNIIGIADVTAIIDYILTGTW